VNTLANGNNHNDSNPKRDSEPEPESKRPLEDEISDRLFRVPLGHHYLVLYSNIESMRKVYANYIKRQMEEQPDSVVLFLSYYDTTDTVRSILKSKGLEVKEYEKKGSIIILDIVKALKNTYFEVPVAERLRELTRKLESQFKDKTIFVIADMSVFHHLNKSSELLEYERNLHKDLKIERWKELCMYHKNDFKSMFKEEDANTLMEYHKDRVIMV
jgi:hypothetical protein